MNNSNNYVSIHLTTTFSTLDYKPRIRPIGDIYLPAGGSLDVPCSSDALPIQVTYRWERVGGGTFTSVDNILKIVNLRPQDTGLYRCVATNTEGSSVEAVNVKIVSSKDLYYFDSTGQVGVSRGSSIFGK